MQSIVNDACALNVVDSGPKGAPVVMFGNSLGTDLRVWDPMLPYLPDGLRVIRYDKRGHGLSDCPQGPYQMDTLVEDAVAITDALGLTHVAFVGLSIGGLIGQGVALARPKTLAGLVLMDTAAKIGDAAMWEDRIAALREGGLASMTDAILDRWFAPEMRGDAQALAPWRNMLERTPLEGYIGCCAAIAGADFTDQAADIKVPVMAMVGSDDAATSPALVQATAELYNAPCQVIDNAGHLPCVEKPEVVGALITTFLKEIGHV